MNIAQIHRMKAVNTALASHSPNMNISHYPGSNTHICMEQKHSDTGCTLHTHITQAHCTHIAQLHTNAQHENNVVTQAVYSTPT